MKKRAVPNSEFLDNFLASGLSKEDRFLLPHESVAVEQAVARQRRAYEKVVDEKVQVSGGDDWHDGAFRATDNEAKIIGQQMQAIAPFIDARAVDYPVATEIRATLGSRVFVTQDGYTYPVDVVGFRVGYPDDVVDEPSGEEVIAVSPEAPLGEALLGHPAGAEVSFDTGGVLLRVAIERIDQLAVKEFFKQTE